MPETCCIVGCSARRGRESRKAGIRMFRIPSCRRRRAVWLRSISRNLWEPKKWDRVCNRHFVSGEPSDDPDDIDYRPTLFMKVCKSDKSVDAGSTLRQKHSTKHLHEAHMREMSEVYMADA